MEKKPKKVVAVSFDESEAELSEAIAAQVCSVFPSHKSIFKIFGDKVIFYLMLLLYSLVL